ncbi:efflux RND transporter periplasmic adaptor subunit [bacterium]|nr:efflux RND transporter periplasmic adaptor subunit [bacterium]
MKLSSILPSLGLVALLSSCHKDHEEHHEEAHPAVVTTPIIQDVTITQEYVCQIHSARHIEMCAVEGGYLQEIAVKEGQKVEKGDLLFQIMPAVFQAEVQTKEAEAKLSSLKLQNTKRLADQGVVSANEVSLAEAEFQMKQSEVNLAKTHLSFTNIKAPFSGIIDRFECQQGSLIEEDMVLTTLSDNSTMWVYFNLPEKRYLEYQEDVEGQKDIKVELLLANQKTFDQPGEIAAIEADFDNRTGNIAFRADFKNPTGILRNGQTGKILLLRPLKDAVVIPARATFEVLDKRFVFVVDEEGVAHQRKIEVIHELEDVLVIGEGLKGDEKIIFEGTRGAKDGEEIEFSMIDSAEVMKTLKFAAE